jgi:acyl-coenzyme A synthetase/AMP-(fatty) acid ligase
MKDGQQQDAGREGELYISGRNVARGYLNRTSLTQERFVSDPYDPGNRMYKTGDLVKQRPDGQILYLGRIDNQIKINGRRIELGEIESCICEFGGIEKCAVVAKRTSETVINLVAFLVTPEKRKLETLVDYLYEQLPDYMVPSKFVDSDELPILSSGKIDRNRLLATLKETRVSEPV